MENQENVVLFEGETEGLSEKQIKKDQRRQRGIVGIVISSIFLAVALFCAILGFAVLQSFMQSLKETQESGDAGQAIGMVFAAIIMFIFPILFDAVGIGLCIPTFIINLRRLILKKKYLALNIVYTALPVLIVAFIIIGFMALTH